MYKGFILCLSRAGIYCMLFDLHEASCIGKRFPCACPVLACACQVGHWEARPWQGTSKQKQAVEDSLKTKPPVTDVQESSLLWAEPFCFLYTPKRLFLKQKAIGRQKETTGKMLG